MDALSAIFIGILCGLFVFKEILWHQHVKRLEDMIRTGGGEKVIKVDPGEPIDPGEKEVTMAKADTTIPIDDAPNPFAPGGNVRVTP